MKNLLKLLPILLLLISFVACKKDKDNSTLKANELLNYQLVVTLQSPTKTNLRIVYFTQVGNDVMATIEGVNVKNTHIATLRDDKLSIDENGDGKIVYDFSLGKNATGDLVISTLAYTNKVDVTVKIEAKYITKAADIYPFRNNGYDGDVAYGILTFTSNAWYYGRQSNKPGTFSDLAVGAWKGNLDGKAYMGVSIKENDRWWMILQIAEDEFRKFYLV